MRIFASDRVKNFMKALGMRSAKPSSTTWSVMPSKAQRKVEGRNFDMRKQLASSMTCQRAAQGDLSHAQHASPLTIGETITDFRREVLDNTNEHIAPRLPDSGISLAWKALFTRFNLRLPIQQLKPTMITSSTKKPCVRAHSRSADHGVQRRSQKRCRRLRTFEKQKNSAACSRRPVEDHLSTMDHLRPRYSPARLRSESQTEVQARGILTLPGAVGLDQGDTCACFSHVQVRREDPADEDAPPPPRSETIMAERNFSTLSLGTAATKL
jgi:preprotein translocase subunit SecA